MDQISIDRCTLHLTGSELAVIVKYLHEGPFKEVSAVVHKIEQQVLAQWREKQLQLNLLDELRKNEPVPQQ